MRERPILFSGPLVRAILEGRKTQTRRVAKIKLDRHGFVEGELDDHADRCPYGAPGDRLWVRETWRPRELADTLVDGVEFPDGTFVPIANTPEAADAWVEVNDRPGRPDRWRPSIHMPRWASRIDLEVIKVRIERVQAITEEDARAEGVAELGDLEPTWRSGVRPGEPIPTTQCACRFAYLWEHINGKREGCSWDANPWVWVVSFRVAEVRGG
jgi:hypothetical protein